MSGAMAITLREFVGELTAGGLLDQEQAESCLQQFSVDTPDGDAEAFARQLVAGGRITQYQADAALQKSTVALVIGDYHVLDIIGAGGMGQVYKARHRFMDRVVAIKIMHSAKASNSKLVQRFAREVKAAARLTHPNIVTAYDAGETAGSLYLAMEYVDGPDISQVVKARGALTVDQAVNITIQAARGLAYVHSHNLVHRDIKPANLLLGRDGTVKILDLGLARFTEDDEHGAEVSLTMAGRLMGTVEYMAPEHAANAKDADHRSDIYSLGCTLYRLLTGRLPYGGTTLVEKLIAQREHPIPLLSDSIETIPEELQGVFVRMVAKKPADRYQSMDDCIRDLQAAVPEAEKCDVSSLVSAEAPPPAVIDVNVSDAATTPDGEGPTTPDMLDAGEPLQVAPESDPSQLKLSGNWDPPVREPTAEIPVAQKAEPNKKLLLAAGAVVIFIGAAIGLWAIFAPGGSSPEPAPQPPRATDDSVSPTGKSKVYTEWPHDGTEAVRRQRETAKALGVDAEREIDLGNGVKMKLALIPAGKFVMGEPGNKIKDNSQRDVTISRPFYMGLTEVTQEQYESVTGRNPSEFKAPRNPVEMVDWNDATAFCAALSKKIGRAVRLPTEAQWEYACRAGTKTGFSFGKEDKDLAAYGWYKANSGDKTHPVGQKKPNAAGLYDMHGNVFEWCRDWYDEKFYANAKNVDPENTTESKSRVLRGGSWRHDPLYCRAAVRSGLTTGSRISYNGFRVVVAPGSGAE